ncbi:MAG TPA: ATP-binding protein [Isosphaeraceae bacterium]|jgi:signal transduction histidine kinase|nr:ATP-binding protein [Isosphaeraceae bacterium]
MAKLRLRVPLAVQVGAVVALFVAALITLWQTGAAVVEREGRRATARNVLDRAGGMLAKQATDELTQVPEFPFTLNPDEWDALDRRLGAVTSGVLKRFDGVEGGFFVVSSVNRYLGYAYPTEPAKPKVTESPGAPRRSSDPPPREFPVIQSQIDASLEKSQALFVVADVPPSTVAIRTAPVWVEGRLVGATWTMTRLVDPLFLESSVRGYRLSAGLALAGIALALLLTIGLARTVRRQVIERERLQSELRRSERLAALGKLLAGVAHEVRNPLAGIRSTAQLWQRGIGPDAESIADLEAEVDRLEGIVSRLLQFSRADAQDFAPGDLNGVVAEAARLARPTAEEQGVQIAVELASQLPPVAMAAPSLMQVFRNLTTNALQVMPHGGTLRLATRHHADRGQVEALVSDTGPGLAPEAIKHLFEPFFTTKAEGTGLGLAIAREIALAHRGELLGENRGGEAAGATFVLTLPVLEDTSTENS